jgi:hypothetical protein
VAIAVPQAAHAADGPFTIDGVVADAGADNFPDTFGSVKELGPLNSNTTKIGVIHNDAVPTLGLTLPQVVGWLGLLFFCTMSRRRSSCSRCLRPPRPPANRVGVDHAVVGERGRGVSVQVSGLPEGGQDDRAGDPPVGGYVQGEPGVVVEPADDLDVRGRWAGRGGVWWCEAVVGEVGLPHSLGIDALNRR